MTSLIIGSANNLVTKAQTALLSLCQGLKVVMLISNLQTDIVQ
jgi:hypothetical protein